jgi:hypothetical protein
VSILHESGGVSASYLARGHIAGNEAAGGNDCLIAVGTVLDEGGNTAGVGGDARHADAHGFGQGVGAVLDERGAYVDVDEPQDFPAKHCLQPCKADMFVSIVILTRDPGNESSSRFLEAEKHVKSELEGPPCDKSEADFLKNHRSLSDVKIVMFFKAHAVNQSKCNKDLQY